MKTAYAVSVEILRAANGAALRMTVCDAEWMTVEIASCEKSTLVARSSGLRKEQNAGGGRKHAALRVDPCRFCI